MTTPARRRADFYAGMVPAHAEVIVSETHSNVCEMAQVSIKTATETILVTISNTPGKPRTRCSASYWFNSDGRVRHIPVRWLPYRIRNLFLGEVA